MYLFKADKISVVIHISYLCSIECFLFIVIIFMYLSKGFCPQKKIFHSKHEWPSNLILMALLDSKSIQGWKVSNSYWTWFQSLSALVNDWLINWDFWDSLYRPLVEFLFQETFLAFLLVNLSKVGKCQILDGRESNHCNDWLMLVYVKTCFEHLC